VSAVPRMLLLVLVLAMAQCRLVWLSAHLQAHFSPVGEV
jgi:hypothetical protein